MSKDNIDFIFEVMKMKLDHLYDASNALDQKISVTVGFLATITAGATLFFGNNLKFTLYPLDANFFTLGIFSIFSSIPLCIAALANRKYYYPPHEDQLYSENSINSDTHDLKSQTIADMKEGFVKNHETHECKAKIFNYSLYFLMLGIFLIAVQFL